jgi:hypothetical protein
MNLVAWLGNAAIGVTPAVVAIGVLVDIVAKMDHVVDRILPHGVTVSVEETEGWWLLVAVLVHLIESSEALTVVTARVNSKLDGLRCLAILCWDGLGPSQRGRVV